MAFYAAHLTRTLQGSPSVFQITAQEALGNTIKPALQKLIEYLAASYPDKFGWSLKWYDEIFLLFDTFLQYHYLKHYAATFSESFYGLLRAPLHSETEFNSGTRLPARLETLSLCLVTLLPYLKDKAERIVEKWRDDDKEGRLGKGNPALARKAAIRVYSTIHLVLESWRLLQLARYLIERTKSPTPALSVLGLTLRDAPAQIEEADAPSWKDVAYNIMTGRFRSAVVSFPSLGRCVVRGAEYGAFAVHFLRWRHAAAPPAALQPPAPPEMDEKCEKYKNKCPICLQKWKIPTVLPVSGYIFCYRCISRQLRSQHACPVTSLPASEDSLIRLYIDD